jgi:16S rRNA (adenine1518-N6/adenine1519-N6)-dimethyltransferase
VSLGDLPPLRETLADAGLLARKSFGQHFLLDLNLTTRIARAAGPLQDATVIEIGPGPGGLTRALLESGAAEVAAVEKDPRFLPLLAQLSAAAPGRLTVVEADALRVDEAALAAGRPAKVVANLPYNVGTPLLIKWLTGPWRPAGLTRMFQKEVAQRIVAAPGEDAYGRRGVICPATATGRIAMTLPARAFTPPPKVDSAVVVLEPRADAPEPGLLKKLEKVTAAAFRQRRKMLRSSLKPLGGEALCRAAGLDPDARAETIPVDGFLRLASALSS